MVDNARRRMLFSGVGGGVVVKLDFSKAYDCIRWKIPGYGFVQNGIWEEVEGLGLEVYFYNKMGRDRRDNECNSETVFTHLQFADDTILFLKPEEHFLLNVKRVLRCFEVSSGLSINFSKSCIVGVGVDVEMTKNLAQCCGCKIGSLPFNYLVFLSD
ncbi:hypothetical protein GQ457_17G001480 [Hibiscus cannabinus]